MENFAKRMTDEQLIDIVRAIDRVAKPIKYRFEGDDEPIVRLVSELGLDQGIVGKLLITGEVLRECAHRGLQITRSNDPEHTADEVSAPAP